MKFYCEVESGPASTSQILAAVHLWIWGCWIQVWAVFL